MKTIKSFLFLSILFTVLFSCQTNSEKKTNEFSKKFQGFWKLSRLTADSVVAKFPVTLNVEDTAFLFRQTTQYGETTYRNWIFENSTLLLPYSNSSRKEDTLKFKVLEINEKQLTLQRKDSISVEFDTLYFEKY